MCNFPDCTFSNYILKSPDFNLILGKGFKGHATGMLHNLTIKEMSKHRNVSMGQEFAKVGSFLSVLPNSDSQHAIASEYKRNIAHVMSCQY